MTPVVLSVFGVVILALVRTSDRRIVIAQPALFPASQPLSLAGGQDSGRGPMPA